MYRLLTPLIMTQAMVLSIILQFTVVKITLHDMKLREKLGWQEI